MEFPNQAYEHYQNLEAEGLNPWLPDRLENHQRGYTVIPIRALYDSKLSPLARLLYCCLLSLDYSEKGHLSAAKQITHLRAPCAK